MKILYLKLINFSSIYTVFKSKTLTIDFSSSKNKIILLKGRNGSGKTSILASLHPFANNGNLDVRSDDSIIRIGEEGYKEIHILDNHDTYIIKHFYHPSKESHSIKSYVEKNGIELNENGNVRSFKEIIKEELGIEDDYLKLIRLGDNVTNFIDLKTSERKTFMGKILNEVDIYLKFYKKIVLNIREVKSIISHTIDKIDKLSIDNKKELEKKQKKLETKISDYKSEMDKIINNLNVINHEISKYPSVLELHDKLAESIKNKNNIDKYLSKKNFTKLTLEDCEKSISDLIIKQALIKNNNDALYEKRQFELNRLDKLLLDAKSIDKELNKISESQEIKETEHMIEVMRANIEKRSKECKISKMEPKYTKKELEEVILMLDKNMEILNTTFEFGRRPIKKAVEYIAENKNISEYINSHNNKIKKNKLQSLSEYVFNEINKIIGDVKPNCKYINSSGCSIKQFYDKLYDLATEIPDTKIEDEVFVSYANMANKNISTVLSNIRDKKDIIVNMPDSIKNTFILKNILNNILDLKPIYDRTVFYNELSKITEFELQKQDLETLVQLKEKLKLLKKASTNSEYFILKKEELIDDINSTQNNIESIQKEISLQYKNIENVDNSLENMKKIKECLISKSSIAYEIEDCRTNIDKLKILISDNKNNSDRLDDIKYNYNKATTEFNSNDYKLKMYDELNHELNKYNKKYHEMELIKNSLSAKEGIPLLYIQVYLKNIQDITNELLYIIYEDDLYVEDFNITADEFKIPYVTKNTHIKDICYASQGEKSFIKIAMSFALIYHAISKYNIMLLDEIDSTLDSSNREKCLLIIEKLMNMIDAEQLFTISHNNMFDMYPIDIIDTNNDENKENKLANYIKIKLS